jgi:hypothetical protein
MTFLRGQKIRLLTKQGQSLEGLVLSFSSKELWIQNDKNDMIWIPSPYENLGLMKILAEDQAKVQGPYRDPYVMEQEFDPEGYGEIVTEEEIEPQFNSVRVNGTSAANQAVKKTPTRSLSIEEEMRRDLPRLKQRLAESGLSLEDLQSNYSLPNFGQYNVSPSFPSTPQYPRTETPRSANRGAQKMRRMFEE